LVLVDIAERSRSSRSTVPDQRNGAEPRRPPELPAAITRCDADDGVDVMILQPAPIRVLRRRRL